MGTLTLSWLWLGCFLWSGTSGKGGSFPALCCRSLLLAYGFRMGEEYMFSSLPPVGLRIYSKRTAFYFPLIAA